jgi:hypothetical protein
MSQSLRAAWSRQWLVLLGVLLGLFGPPTVASGQGCMPLHFTFPGLAGGKVNFYQAHDWQLGVTIRSVATNRFFVGDQEDQSAAPAGQPLNLRLNSLDVSLTYAVDDQLSLTLSVPLSYSTDDHTHFDSLRHQVSGAGVGDINIVGNVWLGSPIRHPNGNIALGLGLKAPTGNYHITGDSYSASGVVKQVPVTGSLQAGDGGWAVLLEGSAFQQLFSRGSAYFSGSYAISMREHTDVFWPPAQLLMAVPDVYSARLGLTYGFLAEPGLSFSLGGRVDGTPSSDLLGGHDSYYRSAGYTMYVEPGGWLQVGPSEFSLSVPIRVYHSYSTVTNSEGQSVPGKGGVNDYVLYAGYTWRF